VLEDIKSDPALMAIPVLVLTSSEAEEDVLRSYRLHANCFVTKPGDLDELTRVVRGIADFWFGIVRLPR
jgi:CheY-like chemotaxis protein